MTLRESYALPKVQESKTLFHFILKEMSSSFFSSRMNSQPANHPGVQVALTSLCNHKFDLYVDQ